jgi:hypothetical protein
MVASLIAACSCLSAGAEPAFQLSDGDVVAFVGGANVVAAQETGHLETLLTLEFPAGIRYRSLAWEADTVFARPRDLLFPPLPHHLQRMSCTVIILQFGQAESLQGKENVRAFKDAYRKLLHELLQDGDRRALLVTPPPFEPADGALPDLSPRNEDVASYAEAIREIGLEENHPVVDLFAKLHTAGTHRERLTFDGLQLSPYGHGVVAEVFARELGLEQALARAGTLNAGGRWSNPACENLRAAIIEKNRLWFDYFRPMNWAFLGGDRVEQASSRDHRNPEIRWFPEEMEQFLPLIRAAEKQIEQLAATAVEP